MFNKQPLYFFVYTSHHNIILTNLQVFLQRDNFLLLLLQEGTQGFHMLQSQFQHHSFLQMTQRLKQEDLR